MLTFLGTGAAFNTALGNTAAYMRDGDNVLLIDCGCTVFSILQKHGILHRSDDVYVLITHCHPDHAGSLGDLIFYSHIMFNKNITVYGPAHLKDMLGNMGVTTSFFNFVSVGDSSSFDIASMDLKIERVKVDHTSTLPCFAYIVRNTVTGEAFYYSGDACKIADTILLKFLQEKINFIYHEVCEYEIENNPHMNIKKLLEEIPITQRHRVICMHFDDDSIIQTARENGFTVAVPIGEKDGKPSK